MLWGLVSFVTNTTALLLFLPGPTRAGVVRLELDALGFPADRELRSRAGQLQPQTETKGSLGGIRTACGDEHVRGVGEGGTHARVLGELLHVGLLPAVELCLLVGGGREA